MVAVSYTTGTSGHQLKWLPYRPAKQVVERRVADTAEIGAVHTVAAVEPQPGPGPLLPVQTTQQQESTDPFKDPFGDRAAQPSPPAQLNDGLLQKAPPQPLPAQSMPQLLDPPAAVSEEPAQLAPPDLGTLEQELAVAPLVQEEECPSPESLKRIREIDYKIAPPPGEFPTECTLGDASFVPRDWAPLTFTWKASSLCHKPLYFEDVHLERYGHSWGPILQPFMSAGHFFLTVPVLPYAMGLCPPDECIYTLGYYRPGNCAPYILDPIPLSVRAALIQGGVYTGMAFLIP